MRKPFQSDFENSIEGNRHLFDQLKRALLVSCRSLRLLLEEK